MLIDAGPLTASLDRNEPRHQVCVELLKEVSAVLVTTGPAFTEAMHLLRRVGGWQAQDSLWRLVLRGEVEIATLDGALWERARDLMEKYRDLPMDLADATLVAVAEARDLRRIFTLDRHFRVYRLHGRTPFDVVP